jgi:hypothetical protein
MAPFYGYAGRVMECSTARRGLTHKGCGAQLRQQRLPARGLPRCATAANAPPVTVRLLIRHTTHAIKSRMRPSSNVFQHEDFPSARPGMGCWPIRVPTWVNNGQQSEPGDWRIPVGVQLQQDEIGPTSGPTRRLFSLLCERYATACAPQGARVHTTRVRIRHTTHSHGSNGQQSLYV